MVGVHPDTLPRAVLVHDALNRERAAEVRPEPFGHDTGPAWERRGGDRRSRAPVVVLESIVLHAPAQLGEPGRLGDAKEDARLLRGGDEVGDDDRPVGEDAVGVARHALSPGAKRAPAWALGSDSGGRARSGLQKGGPTPKRRSPRREGGETQHVELQREIPVKTGCHRPDRRTPGCRRRAWPDRSPAPTRAAPSRSRSRRSACPGTAPARRGRGESRSRSGRRPRRASTSAASGACPSM